MPGEKQPGSAVDVVAAAARPAGGIARPALREPPAPLPHFLFPLFYLVEIRHRQLLQSQLHRRSEQEARLVWLIIQLKNSGTAALARGNAIFLAQPPRDNSG